MIVRPRNLGIHTIQPGPQKLHLILDIGTIEELI